MGQNTVREIDNQFRLNIFRTSQIATSSNYVSGNGGTFDFHASGFVNRANVQQLIFVGGGTDDTNYDIEFFMTSSMDATERQYYYTNINSRVIDQPLSYIPIVDNDGTEHLHGRITNNATSGMFMNYIEIRYNKMLEVS